MARAAEPSNGSVGRTLGTSILGGLETVAAATVAATVAWACAVVAGVAPRDWPALLAALVAAVAAWSLLHVVAGRAAAALHSATACGLHHVALGRLVELGDARKRVFGLRRAAGLLGRGVSAMAAYDSTYRVRLLGSVFATVGLAAATLAVAPGASLVTLCSGLVSALLLVAYGRAGEGGRTESGEPPSSSAASWQAFPAGPAGDQFRVDLSAVEDHAALGTADHLVADAGERYGRTVEAAACRRRPQAALRTALLAVALLAPVASVAALVGEGRAVPAAAALAVAVATPFPALSLVPLVPEADLPRRAGAARRELHQLLSLDVPEAGGTLVPDAGDHLSMSRVSYEYPTPDGPVPAVAEASLDVAAVGITAVVGPTGSGKTTALRLLSGDLSGYEGRIMLGGKPLDQVDRAALARYVTFVGADSFLFAGSVRDNLLMGDPAATEGEMWSVLSSVGLDRALHEGDGLDARVQSGGSNLGPGARHQLALARALLHNSPVYVVDGVVDGCDAESSAAMMQALRGIARYKAVVLVTSRLANVVDARDIYVMDKGRTVVSGTHRELMESWRPYHDTFERQRALETFALRRGQELGEVLDG